MTNVAIMVEQAAAAEWERINAPDPLEQKMKDAALDMRLAVYDMEHAADYLADAVEDLNDTPLEDRIAAFLNELEDLRCDISLMASKFEKGVRE